MCVDTMPRLCRDVEVEIRHSWKQVLRWFHQVRRPIHRLVAVATTEYARKRVRHKCSSSLVIKGDAQILVTGQDQ